MQISVMPDIQEYVTIAKAADHPKVDYTIYWIRRLCQEGKIEAIKIEGAAQGTWLVRLPSLLAYIEEMDTLGTQKFSPKS
jgi:ribosomal silencing factor RsfS